MQDRVVLTHYRAVIKGLIKPAIAITSIKLNVFLCWINDAVTKNILVIADSEQSSSFLASSLPVKHITLQFRF